MQDTFLTCVLSKTDGKKDCPDTGSPPDILRAVHELNCAYFFGDTPTALVNAFR